jgi:hypothetical protein
VVAVVVVVVVLLLPVLVVMKKRKNRPCGESHWLLTQQGVAQHPHETDR